jgi:hypothetical protein
LVLTALVVSRAGAFSPTPLLATSATVSLFILIYRVTSGPDISLDFLPSYLFTALSNFSWVCWIAPNNVKLNQMFGIRHGLAMGVLSFDWGQITTFSGSPLSTPWWAAANIGLAIVFFAWFLIPVLYVSPIHLSSFLRL